MLSKSASLMRPLPWPLELSCKYACTTGWKVDKIPQDNSVSVGARPQDIAFFIYARGGRCFRDNGTARLLRL